MVIGEAACLGPILTADGPLLFNWINSLGLAHINGVYRPTDQPKFDAWISTIGNDPSKVVFSIRRQRDLSLLGYIQVVNIQAAARTGEIGILIGEEIHRGKGYGQEALKLMIGFCWRELNLQRLALFISGPNERAEHVYRKVGFRHEGTLRRAGYVDGRHVDVTVMAILRPDEG